MIRKFLKKDQDKKFSKTDLIKIIISIALLAYVYSSVGIKGVLAALKNFSVNDFIFVTGMYLASQVLSIMKWNLILNWSGCKVSWNTTARAYFTGMLVNLVGVGTIGGDAARGLMVTDDNIGVTKALSTVVSDRIHGLSVLAMIGVISIMSFYPDLLGSYTKQLTILTGLGIILGWWIGPRVAKKIPKLPPKLIKIINAIDEAFIKKPSHLVIITVISAIFHSMQIATHIVILSGLTNMDVPNTFLFSAVPLVNIAASLPISFNGLGVREKSYIVLFGLIGIPEIVAISTATVWFGAIVTATLIGGLIIFMLPKDKISDAHEKS